MGSLLSNEEILPKLTNIIVEALRIDRQRINWEAKLFLDLEAESLDVIDIRFRIEQDFGFKIKDREIVESLGKELTSQEITEKLTIGSIVEFISQRLENSNNQI